MYCASPPVASAPGVVEVILHDIAEAMPGDPPDLAQRRLDLGAAVIAQPLGEPGRDGVLLVVPGTDDERKAEFGLVLRVGVLEPGDLLFAENDSGRDRRRVARVSIRA